MLSDEERTLWESHQQKIHDVQQEIKRTIIGMKQLLDFIQDRNHRQDLTDIQDFFKGLDCNHKELEKLLIKLADLKNK